MNVNKRLREMEGIKNTVCRDDGTLEVYSTKNVQNKVFRFLNQYSLLRCFVKVDFYDMSKW